MIKTNKLMITVSAFVLTLLLFTAFAYADGEKTGIVTGDDLNVRKSPDIRADVLIQLSKGVKVLILDVSGSWYKIAYGDVTGWVYGEFLSLKDEAISTGVINADDVNVRSNPDLSSEVLTRLNKGENVSIFGRTEDWYKIKVSDGKSGWVYKEFLTVKRTLASRGAVEDGAVSVESSKEEEGNVQQKIVNYAKKFLGVRYVYGGSSPKGFDCSGFVQYVYNYFGIKLERVSASQAKHGVKVGKDSLKTGDLVFFDTNGGHNAIEHVGIYIGNGKFIHASSGRTARKVIISDLTEGFYANTYMTARRYIN